MKKHNYEQRGNETLVAGAGPSIVVDARILFIAFASLLLYRRLERGKHRCGLRALRRSRDCGLRALRLWHPLLAATLVENKLLPMVAAIRLLGRWSLVAVAAAAPWVAAAAPWRSATADY